MSRITAPDLFLHVGNAEFAPRLGGLLGCLASVALTHASPSDSAPFERGFQRCSHTTDLSPSAYLLPPAQTDGRGRIRLESLPLRWWGNLFASPIGSDLSTQDLEVSLDVRQQRAGGRSPYVGPRLVSVRALLPCLHRPKWGQMSFCRQVSIFIP